MDILEVLLLNFVFILFPLFTYFLFATAERNLNKKTRDILFDMALYSSLYLVLRCETTYVEIKLMFITLPLLIAYLRSKKTTTLIFSISIALYCATYFNVNMIYIVLELVTYFAVMFYFKKKNKINSFLISMFTIIKTLFIALENGNFNMDILNKIKEFILLPVAFYFIAYVICYLIAATEKTMSLHMTMKELEHQKQLRDSLFKITHEIKNPIAVCKGYLDMLDIDNKDHLKRYVPIIRQEIERTLTIMNDFMTLTKINVEMRRMDISVLLEDVCEMTNFMLTEKNIKLVCSIIDEETYIEADYNRLKQVLINVIKNAIEAIPSSRKGILKFSAKKCSKGISISVIDNGIGMNKKSLARVGEAFYTTKKGGTGLGAKFSKEIIEAHQGCINYKSRPNIGTTVTISLPLKKSLK
ncbi:MAG: HAMP domain-containing sensor histidine kinase [Bacilli bacterium]